MLKSISTVLLFLTITLITIDASAESRKGLWVSAAAGREGSGWSIGGRGQIIGLDIAMTNSGEYKSDDVLDYPVPHSNYTTIGEKKKDSAVNIDILGFYDFTHLSIFAGIGVYMQKYATLARSNVTGWTYEQSTRDSNTPDGTVGFQIYPDKWILGLSYHTMRGAVLQVGLRF